jgi:hypothetical protein
MSRKKLATHLSVFLFVVFSFSACTFNMWQDNGPLDETPMISPTETSRPPQPTSTVKPTVTSTSTQTAIPTPTKMVTLEPEQAKEEIRKLFAEPVPCEQACFLGIVPGKTTLEQATVMVKRLGSHIRLTRRDGKLSYYGTRLTSDELSMAIVLTSKATSEGEIIVGIDVAIDTGGSFSPKPRELWQALTIPVVLKTYGKPSEVYIAVRYGPLLEDLKLAPPHYDIDLVYEDEQLQISYEAADTVRGESIPACPDIDLFSSVRVWFGENPSNPYRVFGFPIEESTDINIDEFYNGMLDEENYCFSIIGSLFPP